MIRTIIQSNGLFHLLFILSVGLISCADENDNPPLTLSEFYNCHHQIPWNEIATRDSLIGRWQWI